MKYMLSTDIKTEYLSPRQKAQEDFEFYSVIDMKKCL